jgi:hypothetical protein
MYPTNRKQYTILNDFIRVATVLRCGPIAIARCKRTHRHTGCECGHRLEPAGIAQEFRGRMQSSAGLSCGLPFSTAGYYRIWVHCARNLLSISWTRLPV